MALTDPLDLTAILRASDFKLDAAWQQQMSGTGGGERLYADRSPMLRRIEITTPPMTHADAEAILALLNSRSGGIRAVLLPNYRLPCPSTDPDGSIFGSAAPEVGAISDRRTVAFTGFPAGYVMPGGTYFGIEFGSGRRYLGQFAESRTANGGGAIAAVEVTPPLPASIASTDPVTVIWPVAKFKIVPGSAVITQVTAGNSRVALQADQTYEPDPT